MRTGLERLAQVAMALACTTILVCTLAPAALADTAGNTLVVGDGSGSSSLGGSSGGNPPIGDVEKNLYWVGYTLDLSGSRVERDVIAAGQNLALDDAEVGGNVRTASQDVSIAGTDVGGDITSAAQILKIGKGTTCSGAYLTAATVEFGGEAKALYASAQTVTITGKVDGDVHVSGGNVVVADGAVITGTLTVDSGDQPLVASGAKVGSVEFHQSVSDTSVKPRASVFSVGSLLYYAIVFAIVALILTWVLRRAVEGAGEMVRTRTAPMLVTGLVAMVVAIPSILILLLVAPLAGSLIFAYGMVFFIAAPFAGASIARLVFPKWNRFGAAALGGAVAGALVVVPVVQVIFIIAAFMYLLGYALQCIYLGMRGDVTGEAYSSAPTAPSVPEPDAVDGNAGAR